MTARRTEMRYSPGFQRLLEYAAYDCAQAGSTQVCVDHLLFGLYREDFPLIDEVLASFRVDSLVVLDRLLRQHPEAVRPSRPETVRMSPEALRAIDLAEKEAERLGHEQLEPPHTLVGILEYNRASLERYFIREAIVREKEDQVLDQVRRLVSWLRFEATPGAVREVETIDVDTVAGFEMMPLPTRGERKAFAVRLRLLKEFGAR